MKKKELEVVTEKEAEERYPEYPECEMTIQFDEDFELKREYFYQGAMWLYHSIKNGSIKL